MNHGLFVCLVLFCVARNREQSVVDVVLEWYVQDVAPDNVPAASCRFVSVGPVLQCFPLVLKACRVSLTKLL